jgi:hypothetical protein
MPVLRSKPFIGLLVFLFVLIGLVGSFVYLNDRFDLLKDTPKSEKEKEAFLEKAREEAGARSRTLETEAIEKARSLGSVEDLKALSAEEQGNIGILKITLDMNDNQAAEVLPYIEYLMLRDDIYGLEASRLCYIVQADQAQKEQCRVRATEQARNQEIIAQDETLPDSYFILKQGPE